MTFKGCPIILTACLMVLTPSIVIAADAWQEAQLAVEQKNWAEAQRQLETWLQQRPNDQQARFLLAQVLSWYAKYDAAEHVYAGLLRNNPDNADYLLGLAQVHFWQNRPQEAIPLLKHALKNAPKYQAIWELLVRSLYAANMRLSAEDIQHQAAQYFPHEDWQRLTPPAIPPPIKAPLPDSNKPSLPEYKNIMEIGGSYEKLDHNFDSWNSAYAGGTHYFNKRSSVYGRLTQADRFDMQDMSVMAGLAHPVSERWTLGLETDESPTNHFLPQWSLLGNAHYKMDYGFGALFGFRHASYREQDNDTGSVGLERYWGGWRFSYTLYISQLEAAPEPTFSHLGQVAYYYNDKNYVGVAIGGGQEMVRLGPGRINNADTESYSLQGQHWLTPEWAVVYNVNLNVQGTSYTRRGFGLGLRYAF